MNPVILANRPSRVSAFTLLIAKITANLADCRENNGRQWIMEAALILPRFGGHPETRDHESVWCG